MHAAGEDWVDEGKRIAHHQVAVAAHGLPAIRIVGGSIGSTDEFRARHPFGDRGAEGDRIPQERFQRNLARADVRRPTDGADAGGSIFERDNPPPAVVEPYNADVSFVHTGKSLHAFEMAEDGGAVVMRVAKLPSESAR